MTRSIISGTLAISAIALAVHKRREIKAQVRALISQYLDRTRSEPDIAPGKVTSEFRNLVIDKPEGKSNNPHKNSAAIRTAAVAFTRLLNIALDTEECSVSMSSRDQRECVRGTRSYWWAKDTDKKFMHDVKKGALSYTDVDFHDDDLEYVLAGRSSHTTVFTVIPRQAASSGESSHTFNNDGTISVNLAGGSSYRHSLWDWTPDVMTCSRRVLGVPYLTTIYKVEKKSIDQLKSVVVLAPISTWFGLPAIFADMLSSHRLQRLDCVENGFAHLRHVTADGVQHSIARTGGYTSAELTSTEFDSMREAAINGKQAPSTSAMATWCDQERVKANIMAGYFRSTTAVKAPFVTRVEDAVISVSANVKQHGDCDERVSVQAFMQPIVADNCHAHTDHPDNAKWAAEARITSLVAPTKSRLNPFVAGCIKEFAKLALPKRLAPEDLSLVHEKQNRPIQRNIVAEAVAMGPSEKTSLSAFLKKEAYAGAKDPRIITTYRPGVKVGYSVYMYALTLQMKEHAWYGFKTPEEVAARVSGVCLNSDYAVEGDFSRMDGRVDHNVRLVFEKALLNRAFPGDDEVHRLHELQFGQTVSLQDSTYQQGYARGSGSPETSVFNTMLTAFVMYLALRMLALEPAEAFQNIGIVAGDDSLQGGINSIPAEVFSRKIEASARQMGQKLTSDLKHIGEPVQFLSRYFGGAWHGDLNSMACPLRLLSKIHCAVNLGAVAPEDKCRTKGESILSADGNTPIIGALASKMTTVGQELEGQNREKLVSWWSQHYETSWPNEYADWMEDIIRAEMPDFDHEMFNHWLVDGDVLQAPTCLVIKPKVHARDLLVGGELSSSNTTAGRAKSKLSGKNPKSRKTKRFSDTKSTKTV